MKTKVLLVDDEIAVHAALNAVLRGEGYDVIWAFDGREALERPADITTQNQRPHAMNTHDPRPIRRPVLVVWPPAE